MLPDLPTAEEQGIKDFDASAWHGVFLAKGTESEIVNKLTEALAATLDTPSVAERLTQLGAIVVAPSRRSPAYLKTFVASEIDKWGATIKSTNLQVE